MSPAWRSRVGRQIAAYLTLKTALGRRFFSERYIFVHLDRFLARRRAAALTRDAFVAWCRTFLHVSPTVRRTRMRVVRNFCLYLRRRDRACFVPDPSGFPAPHVAPTSSAENRSSSFCELRPSSRRDRRHCCAPRCSASQSSSSTPPASVAARSSASSYLITTLSSGRCSCARRSSTSRASSPFRRVPPTRWNATCARADGYCIMPMPLCS